MTNEDLKKMITDDGLYDTFMYSIDLDALEDDETHGICQDLIAAINNLEQHIGL